MNIRRFSEADTDEIIRLFRDTVHNVNSRDYTEEQLNAWAPEHIDTDKWRTSLCLNITYVTINEQGKITGFGDLAREGLLHRLYTHTDFQGCGAGSMILKKLELEAEKAGLSEIYTESSVTAKSFFESHGFKIVEIKNKLHRGVYFTVYSMAKKIGGK